MLNLEIAESSANACLCVAWIDSGLTAILVAIAMHPEKAHDGDFPQVRLIFVTLSCERHIQELPPVRQALCSRLPANQKRQAVLCIVQGCALLGSFGAQSSAFLSSDLHCLILVKAFSNILLDRCHMLSTSWICSARKLFGLCFSHSQLGVTG